MTSSGHLSILHLASRPSQRARLLLLACLVAGLALAACQSNAAPPTAVPDAEMSGEADNPGVTSVAPDSEIVETDPLPSDETAGPVRLQIPAIDLDVPIIAMGWRVGVVDGVRTTVWDVPTDRAGWHINSTGAGGAGNTIISGRQVGDNAVFAPLALGAVQPGQEVYLTDGDGFTFVYQITEISEPIPVTGATPEEEQQAAAYFAPSDTARLTLVTGWPEFTTTHRVFALADFVGVQR
jgi:sortase (surface protein transpeptidase)